MGLCVLPYPGHKRGCPNFGKKSYCPPETEFFSKIFKDEIYIAAVGLDFKTYRQMRKKQHPAWTDRQQRNPLYWQGYLKKILKDYTKENFTKTANGKNEIVYNPEAMGIDLTRTCRQIGIFLEWPPDNFVYKIAVIGTPKNNIYA